MLSFLTVDVPWSFRRIPTVLFYNSVFSNLLRRLHVQPSSRNPFGRDFSASLSKVFCTSFLPSVRLADALTLVRHTCLLTAGAWLLAEPCWISPLAPAFRLGFHYLQCWNVVTWSSTTCTHLVLSGTPNANSSKTPGHFLYRYSRPAGSLLCSPKQTSPSLQTTLKLWRQWRDLEFILPSATPSWALGRSQTVVGAPYKLHCRNTAL